MTEHLPELLRSVEIIPDAHRHLITYMDGQTERAVWDTGRAMLSMRWTGLYWDCDGPDEVRSWSPATLAAYEQACDRLEGPSRRKTAEIPIQGG